MNKNISRQMAAYMLAVSIVASVHAQWSDDPAVGLAVANVAGDQVQAKVAARPGGGYYLSWFDNRSSGFDLYIQFLDAAGNPQLAANGVLVADRAFSSTQDYGLGVDAAGNALLAFRDDRSGATQITAARVAADGTLVWGAGGVQLTTGAAFVAAPKIAGTSDGDAMVAWKEDNDVNLQRLDPAGAAVFASAINITDAVGMGYSVADLKAADAGAAIVSVVFEPAGFLGPKHLYAQKYSSSGAPLWGAAPLAVFDGGSLQFGNFPAFVADDSGGAVFSWYSTSAGLECYAQRVSAAGDEAFAHNGVAVSTALRDRVNPAVTYDAVSGSTFVFWREELAGPTPQFGIFGQRFDAAGVRQWGTQGIAVASLSTTEVGFPRAVYQDEGVTVFWLRTNAFDDQTILAARFDSGGNTLWSPAQLDVATVASGKSRPWASGGPDPFVVLAWSDNRSGNDDVYVQNVNHDGTLGAAATDADDDGVADNDDNCVLAGNADQRDTDGDGIGNVCDADLNNDCIVNVIDLGSLKSVFFSADPDADFDGNGVVNVIDLGALKAAFFQPPGPSGVANICVE